MLSMAKRAEMFEAKLSQYDLQTLAYIVKQDVQEAANKIADKQIFTINQALQTSISAALYETTELTIEEVEEILRVVNEYMKDSEKFLLIWGVDWIMKINEIKPNIKAECIKLLDKNISGQNEAVRELKKTYKEIPNKDLVNIFKEAKTEWMKPKEIREKTEVQNKAELEEKEVSNVIASEEQEKGNTEPVQSEKERLLWLSNVFKPTKFQGAHHEYEKVEEGLKIGPKVFKDIKEFEKYKNGKLAELQKQIDAVNSEAQEIEAAFEYLHMR